MKIKKKKLYQYNVCLCVYELAAAGGRIARVNCVVAYSMSSRRKGDFHSLIFFIVFIFVLFSADTKEMCVFIAGAASLCQVCYVCNLTELREKKLRISREDK